MSRKVEKQVSQRLLNQDLKKYRQKALDLGANDAEIITSDMVLVDERVRAKCVNPKCALYGTNANCPPHALDPDMVKSIVNRFKVGIFIRLKMPSKTVLSQSDDDKKMWRDLTLKNFEIISKLEADAFYDGYYLASGLAGSSCKILFCPNMECAALTPGQGCRHPLKARSSMEGWAIDCFRMAANMGWDVYPIGGSSTASNVPYGSRLGLVLIH